LDRLTAPADRGTIDLRSPANLKREPGRPDPRRLSHARMIQHPGWGTVTIEGHCDERGSEEYNLAKAGDGDGHGVSPV
jgi:hypothetical protein